MIRLLLIPLIIFAVPSGIAVSRLLWRYGNLRLREREIKVKELEQKQYERYLN